jgi:glycosyltransferase involved in cell wall biosynthesis
MRFTLIMSTLGRTVEVERFLTSLKGQSLGAYDLYICDQNSDDRLKAVIDPSVTGVPYTAVQSPRGLSRGRNAGLRVALARESAVGADQEIVAFPDDDCWYEPDTLEKVAAALRDHPELAGVTVRSMDQHGAPSARRSPSQWRDLSLNNVLKDDVGISYCIFVRRSFVEAVGEFDESLGVGSGTDWGAGEESDFLIRGLKRGLRLAYNPEIFVSHPRKDAEDNTGRFLSYARGHGRVLRKNGYSWFYLARDTSRALAAMVVKSVLSGRIASGYVSRVRGYLEGYFDNRELA